MRICSSVQAYLRIRPAPEGVPLQSYIQVLNDTDVLMVPPVVSFAGDVLLLVKARECRR